MKRIIPVLLVIFLLSGCISSQTAGPSDDDMATRVASILTEMPAGSTPLPSVTWTALPAVEVTLPPTATLPPSETPPPTPEPSATASLEPTEMLIPTLTVTIQPTAGPGGSATPPPTLTGQPPSAAPGDIRNKLGAPAGVDPMDKATTWNWPTGPNDFTSIDFQNGQMRLTGLTKDSGWRLPLLNAATNLYVEMTVAPQDCSGMDNYGLIFRVPVFREADRGYLYALSCGGQYALWKWDGKVAPDGKSTMLIQWKNSAQINAGSGAFNRMGVMTFEDRLLLYINGVKVDEYRDSTYVGGNFGVFVNPDDEEDFSIWVDEMSYWTYVNP